jgi:diguanylate cyclase (GGDEF)-like protein
MNPADLSKSSPRRDRVILWIAVFVVLLITGLLSANAGWMDRAQFVMTFFALMVIAVIADRLLCRVVQDGGQGNRERLHREQLVQMNRDLLDRLHQDELTRMHNRRALDAFLADYLRSQEFGLQSLSMVLLDIDQFKSINDRYGHLVGDQLLQRLSIVWRSLIRGSDLLARFGGDEFGLVLPGATLAQATMVAQKIRAATEQFRFSIEKDGVSQEISVTVSLGVATADDTTGLDGAGLLAAADEALYAAKAGGRNRVASRRLS